MRKKIFALTLIAVMMAIASLVGGCAGKGQEGSSPGSGSAAGGNKVTVTMLDVGQGDAILIKTPSQTVLIDTSDKDETEKFKAALLKENVKTVDKLIITHPHADHLGGAATLFKNFEVKAVYDNGQLATPKFYREYQKTILKENIPYQSIYDGDVLDLGDGVKFTVLSPTKKMVEEDNKKLEENQPRKAENLNENSVVGRLTFGDFAMMFTGDAVIATENGIRERHKDDEIRSQILKAPHHGSKTSSGQKFLKAVNPEWAVISAGEGNEYHLPHPSVRTRYKQDGIDYYRTDVNGTITIVTDGKTYTIKAERGDKNSDKNN